MKAIRIFNPARSTFLFISIFFLLHSCIKPDVIQPGPAAEKILVDASKDAGVWWYPQTGKPGDSLANHQGKQLVDYLKGLGYQVDELSTDTKITWPLLKQYTKIIRAGGFGLYSPDEIAAYDSFLSRPSSLMLLQDLLKYIPNDLLSKHLGVEFAGIADGTISQFTAHPITAGVSSIKYIAGSAVMNASKNPSIMVLGWLSSTDYADLNFNGVKDAGDVVAPPVMGILQHPKAKIFFLGDINGIEQVPQPFTGNLVKWLF